MAYNDVKWDQGARLTPHNLEIMDSAIAEHNTLIQQLETSAQNKPGLVVETSKEIFNDYETNLSHTAYSTAFGTNNIAGCKGYPIASAVLSEDSLTATITLSDKDIEEKAFDYYSVGDTIQYDAASHWYNKFNISAVNQDNNGNTVLTIVHIDGIEITHSLTLDSDPTENWVWVVSKPYGLPITPMIAPIVFGSSSVSMGNGAFVAGKQNQAIGNHAAVVGRSNKAGYSSFAAGRGNNAMGMYAFAANNNNKALGTYSAVFGQNNTANGMYTFIAGSNSTANGSRSAIFGSGNSTSVDAFAAAVFGMGSQANGEASFAAGETAIANGKNSVAFGYHTVANGSFSLAAGYESRSEGFYSVALGKSTAEGSCAISTGNGSVASGLASFASGSSTASGEQSAAFGGSNTAQGQYSFAGGYNSKATGKSSFAFGNLCNANYEYSVAMGALVSTKAKFQAVFGKFSRMTSDMLFGVGDGLGNKDEGDANEYRNAFSVFNDGHATLRTQGTDGNSVVIKSELDKKQTKITSGTGIPSGGSDGDVYIQIIEE